MISLSSAALNVTVDPLNGAEIVSVVDVASGISLLATAPSVRTRTSHGDLSAAVWEAGYRGGWQVLTPNAGRQSNVDGVHHGFHGRASSDRWRITGAEHSTAQLVWEGHGLHVTRLYEVVGPRLEVTTTWSTASDRPIPMLHVEHFAIGSAFLEQNLVIEVAGRSLDSASPALSFEDDAPHMGFEVLGPLSEGVVEISSQRRELRATLRWRIDELPYLWLWHENRAPEGVWGAEGRVLGLEPASVPHENGLDHAIRHGQATWISAGEPVTRAISLEIVSATHSQRDPTHKPLNPRSSHDSMDSQ